MGYRSNSRTQLRAEANFQQTQFQPRARDVLVSWARARECRDRATGYLQLAKSAPAPDVRDRFIAIAQHYRALAIAERRIANQIGVTPRSDKTIVLTSKQKTAPPRRLLVK